MQARLHPIVTFLPTLHPKENVPQQLLEIIEAPKMLIPHPGVPYDTAAQTEKDLWSVLGDVWCLRWFRYWVKLRFRV